MFTNVFREFGKVKSGRHLCTGREVGGGGIVSYLRFIEFFFFHPSFHFSFFFLPPPPQVAVKIISKEKVSEDIFMGEHLAREVAIMVGGGAVQSLLKLRS